MECRRTPHPAEGHRGWDNALGPIARTAPGDCIEFHTMDAADGQRTPDSAAAAPGTLDCSRVNPVVGPVD
jgi:acetamidase/formamidase